ncbi:MAG: hypothetical protein JO078_05500 [Candidatus Eremiobacteraeota bacterium]|nr:hypothetical protein [Candidatus Eremiobacteraeota bacterium]
MVRTFARLLAILLLSACAAPSPAPKGWHPIAGETGAWSMGSGARLQEYRVTNAPFSGGLQDLASQVTIDVLTRHRGARWEGSAPFASCPGPAGIARFRLPDERRLEEAFSVRNGRAVRIAYVHPLGTSGDPAALEAMKNSLCRLSANQ